MQTSDTLKLSENHKNHKSKFSSRCYKRFARNLKNIYKFGKIHANKNNRKIIKIKRKYGLLIFVELPRFQINYTYL